MSKKEEHLEGDELKLEAIKKVARYGKAKDWLKKEHAVEVLEFLEEYDAKDVMEAAQNLIKTTEYPPSVGDFCRAIEAVKASRPRKKGIISTEYCPYIADGYFRKMKWRYDREEGDMTIEEYAQFRQEYFESTGEIWWPTQFFEEDIEAELKSPVGPCKDDEEIPCPFEIFTNEE